MATSSITACFARVAKTLSPEDREQVLAPLRREILAQLDAQRGDGADARALAVQIIDRMLAADTGEAAPSPAEGSSATPPKESPRGNQEVQPLSDAGDVGARGQARQDAAAAPGDAAGQARQDDGQAEDGLKPRTLRDTIAARRGAAEAAKPAAAPQVFRTRQAALTAKTGNTQRVQKVNGGYILRQATDNEMAAAEKAGKRLANQGGPDITKDSLLTAIAKLGGIAMSERADIIGTGNKNVGGKMLFTTGGMPVDEMAAGALREYGYVPANEVERDGGARWLRDAVRAEFNGLRDHYSEQGIDAIMEAQRAAEEAQYGEELADLDVDDLASSGYIAASPEVQALTERLLQDAEAAGLDAEGLAEDAPKRTEGQTEDEYHRQLQASIAEALAADRRAAEVGVAGAARAGDEDRGPAAGGQGPEEGLTLSAQTEGDLRTKAERENAAAKADADEQKRLADKARADAQRDEFTLTGSDRPADVAAAAGQQDIFSEPAQEPAAPAEAQSTKIDDVGEKIGAARKDLAQGTGTRSTRGDDGDDRPAWARRFKVSQIVKAAGRIDSPRDEGRWVIHDSRSKDWTGQARQVGRNTFATKEEAEAFVPIAAVSLKHRVVLAAHKAPKTESEVDATLKADMAAKAEDDAKPGRIAYMVMEGAHKKLAAGQITQADFDRVQDKYGAEAAQYTLPTARAQAEPGGDKYEIWRDISDRKRVKVVDQTFDSRDDAMRYMAENAAAILETNTTFGEADMPLPPDRQRRGPERRTTNVTGQDFKDAFGLRAVEFGNWNNQEERQGLMNDAWDGLMDLADVMGIPPKAIGLGGDLALAFGARGHGLHSARAHYERNRAVINLTKEHGAGSLAHEWFHALDHYFGRQDGKAPAEWKLEPDGTRTLKTNGAEDYVSHGFRGQRSGARAEMRAAYDKVMQTIAKKATTYVEDTAKADQFTAATREELAQALDRLRRDLSEQKDARYWKRNNKPASAEMLAEFDTIAKAMVDGDTSLLTTDWRTINTGAKAATRWTNDSLERLSAIYKEVRGRSGFDSTNREGALDKLRGYMNRYSQRLKMLADAQQGTEKTRMVPTEFAMEAKELDQGRGEDYWTTPHEMAARAFQGYVEDKIAEGGGVSRFLNYGPPNVGIPTPWGFKRPFPYGDERKAINAALDAFVGELKTREQDGRTILFSREPAADEATALRALSQNDTLFALPKSTKATVAGITADNAPLIKVRETVVNSQETMYRLTAPDGTFAFITERKPNPFGPSVYGYEADNETAITTRPGENLQAIPEGSSDVWIDVSRLRPGKWGAVIYNIAATYAHNTGRMFIGDPAGVSKEAIRRRPEHMLSSALKFGTTRHLAPHPEQVARGLRWVYGDDLGNIRRLVDLNLRALENEFPAARNLTFDVSTGQFTNRTTGVSGGAVSQELLRGLADGAGGGAGAGLATGGGKTLARGAVLNALLREPGGAGAAGGQRDGLLARLAGLADDQRAALAGTFYSRVDGDAQGLSPAEAAAVGALPAEKRAKLESAVNLMRARRIVQSIAPNAGIRVVQSVADMPPKQRDEVFAKAPSGRIRGAYFRNDDQIWLVSDNIRTEADVVFVTLHEAFHRGLTNTFGQQAALIMRRMHTTNANLRELTQQKMRRLGIGQDEAIEEALADMAGKGEARELKGWDRLVKLIRNWLSGMAQRLGFPEMVWSDAMIEEFVAGVRKKGITADGPRIVEQDGARLSADGEQQTDTAEFKRWFGDSKVVDAQGKPLVVYHGTRQEFEAFSADRGGLHHEPGRAGFMFTDSRSEAEHYTTKTDADYNERQGETPRVIEAYLSFQNPLEVEARGEDPTNYFDSHWRRLMNRAGDRDGIIVRGNGSTVFVAFRPEQIKSATGNRGTFDPGDADIRLSATEQPRDDLGRFSKAVPEWVTSGSESLQAAASKIDTYAPTKPIGDKLREMSTGWKDKLVQGMLDAYAPLKKLSMDAYIAARMTKAADGAFEGMLMYGKPAMSEDGGITGDLDGKGFLGVMRELNGDHDRFFMWLAGNRAERLRAEGKENLFTDDEIAAMKGLNSGRMADGRSRAMAYAQAHQQFNAYSKAVLDVAERSGLIDGESRSLWEHDFYVPFYRMSQEQDHEIRGPGMIKGLARQKAFERLKGGRENLGDLMDNTLRNWSHLLSASLSNVAASKSLLAAADVGVAVEAKESIAREMAKAAGIKGNATYFMDHGVQRWFVVEDPAVLQAVSALEAPALNGLPLQLMGKFKKYLTVGVTISPAFKLRNLIRDTLAAPAANEMSYNIAQNLAQGWKATNTKTEDYAQMLFSGGLMRFGTHLEGDRAEHVKRLIAQGVDDKTILNTPQKVKAALSKAWDAWQEFGDRLENVNRTALYKQLLDKGLSPRDAAFQARDMMDFSLQGSWAAMRTLTAIVPFLNARAQGLYKLGRAAKEDPRRMGYMVAAVSLASIALMLAYGDDDDWKDREDWDRDGFWWFKIGDTAFRIPKPFELGAMGTIAERSVEMMISDEMTGKRFGERMKQMLLDTFAMNPVPQAFKPMLDLYANKDSFTGRQIETLGMERLSKGERYGPNTSALARVLGAAGEYTGVSPVQVDHLVRAYFGWLGTQAVAAVDLAASPFDPVARPARKLDDYFAGFVKELPSAQSRYTEEFYKQAKVTAEAMADLRRAREVGDLEKAAEIIAERGDDLRAYRTYQKAQAEMSDINRGIRVARGSLQLDSEAKRERLDMLEGARNRLAKLVSDRTRSLEAAR